MQETGHGSGNRRLSIFGAATATYVIHWLAIIAIGVVVLTSAPARADQWSLLINGKAIHLEELHGSDLNEDNWGAGVQYDFDMTKGKWVPFISASGFKDSNGNPSYYTGGGTVRRFSFGEEKNSVHLDAGVVAFLMIRKDFMNGDPFPGVLPVISLGRKKSASTASRCTHCSIAFSRLASTSTA